MSVHQDSNVGKAVGEMAAHNIGSVVVLDSLGPCGVLTERDLLTKVAASGRKPETMVITEVASQFFPAIDGSADLLQAAVLMVDKKSRLMVFDGADIVGMVTASDLVRSIGLLAQDFSLDPVVSRRPIRVPRETPVDIAVRTMDEKRVGSVLVGEERTPREIFTERDLVKRVLARHTGYGVEVGSVSSSPLVTMKMGSTGKQVAEVMAARRVKRIPLEVEGSVVGIVTARDVVEAFTLSRRLTRPRVEWAQWN